MKHLIPAAFLMLFTSQCMIAQSSSHFVIDAQLRPRFEFRDGYKTLSIEGSAPALLVSQRSRVGFTYQSDRIRLKIVPQDVRIWGDEQIVNTTGVFGDHASLDLHEAYAEVRLFRSTWISVGRQELVYDNQALLSNRNWNQNGIASDAVLLKYHRPGWMLHLGGTWNTIKESAANNYCPSDRWKTLSFLWLNRNLNNILRISAMHVASGITETDSTNRLWFRHTSGINTNMKWRYMNFNGNLFYQYGRNQQGMKVSAWLADAEITQKFGILTPGIGFGYLTGNSLSPDSMRTDHLFNDLYRSKHKFFGFMDYFTNIPVQTAQGGLVDYYGFVDCKLSRNVNIRNIVHLFRLAQTNPNTPDQKVLGYENDLILSYRFADWGNLEAGYLFFLPTESQKVLQGISKDKFSQFAYLMLTLTPKLFTHQN